MGEGHGQGSSMRVRYPRALPSLGGLRIAPELPAQRQTPRGVAGKAGTLQRKALYPPKFCHPQVLSLNPPAQAHMLRFCFALSISLLISGVMLKRSFLGIGRGTIADRTCPGFFLCGRNMDWCTLRLTGLEDWE